MSLFLFQDFRPGLTEDSPRPDELLRPTRPAPGDISEGESVSPELLIPSSGAENSTDVETTLLSLPLAPSTEPLSAGETREAEGDREETTLYPNKKAGAEDASGNPRARSDQSGARHREGSSAAPRTEEEEASRGEAFPYVRESAGRGDRGSLRPEEIDKKSLPLEKGEGHNVESPIDDTSAVLVSCPAQRQTAAAAVVSSDQRKAYSGKRASWRADEVSYAEEGEKAE